jgi:hypothetical protein
MRQDKTNTESNGDKRGPEYQKGSFLRLKKGKKEAWHFRILSDFSLFIGLSAFTDFIQALRYRPDYSSWSARGVQKHPRNI